MAKAILFDLDGTLLPMDTEQFVKHYMKHLATKVAHIIPPEEFVKGLWQATHTMMQNIDETQTNEQVFEQAFFRIFPVKREDIWPLFDEFYEQTFPTFSSLTEPSPLAQQIVQAAVAEGFTVAVATNPVFPRSAIEHRLKWAGISELPFAKVTVYEESRFTKPHAQYYQDICRDLKLAPEDCVMVGNDVQEDMNAGTIGMKTFLVEGKVIDRGEPQYRIDDRGTLAELLERIKQRQGIFA